MHFNWTVTGDGLATLAAGIIAFCAVWWQVRSSACNLQKQMDAEKAARHEEVCRQRLAIASALSAEIEDFRRYHIETFASKNYDGMSVKVWDGRFHVYESNTGRIGELGADACESVVHFYDRAMEYLGAIRRYIEMEHEELSPDEFREKKTERQTKFFLHSISGRIDKLNDAAQKAESALLRVKSTSS